MAIISKQTDVLPAPVGMRVRLVALFAVLLVAVLIIVNLYPSRIVKNEIIRGARKDMLSDASALASALGSVSVMSGGNISGAVSMLQISGDQRRVIVVDTGGVVLFDSIRTQSLLGKVVTFSEVISALEGYDVFYSLYEGEVLNKWASSPVIKNDEIRGAVYIYERDTESPVLLSGISTNIRTVSAVLVACAALMMLLFTQNLGKRFSILLSGVHEVGTGNYSHHIEMSGKDEFTQIVDEVNDLSSKIQQNEKAGRQFVSNASHELKTPLASIKLLSDSIKHNPNISREEINEFLGDISHEIDRLIRISESLVTLNQAEAGEFDFRPCSLNATIKRIAELLRGNAEAAQVTIKTDLHGDLNIMGTVDGLYHIIFNLTENAIKYNRKGGSVTISTAETNGRVAVRVTDTGIGIPEHDQERIYERFFRVDKNRARATGGTGLGLSIVKEWVENFGGTISIKSEYGTGTEFCVELPVCGEAAE